MKSDGPLDLGQAQFPNLGFDWRGIKGSILAAQPDVGTLAALHTRASALGDNEARLDIGD